MSVPENPRSYHSQVKAAGSNFHPLLTWNTPESGSNWSHAHILTFRVTLKTQEDGYPPILRDFLPAAKSKLKAQAFHKIVELIALKPWLDLPRDKLREMGGEFGSFLSHLGEVDEKPWSSQTVRASDRPKKDTPLPQDYPLSDEDEDVNRSGTSAEEQEWEISGRSDNSDRSLEDQDTLNRQNKSETVTSCLIMEYLQSLAQCTRGPDDREFHLEWTTDQDAFRFPIPTELSVISINDGGLVHRRKDAQKRWARVKPLSCYCSIEAKAAHIAQGKKIEVYAQEVSQIVGMIHQREQNAHNAGLPQNLRMIPLISISQQFVYLTIAEYDSHYYDFLLTGNDDNQPFLKLREYGPYKLTDYSRFAKLSKYIVALMLYLENAGPHST